MNCLQALPYERGHPLQAARFLYRPDVLVHPEEIERVVMPLDLDEPAIVRAEAASTRSISSSGMKLT